MMYDFELSNKYTHSTDMAMLHVTFIA